MTHRIPKNLANLYEDARTAAETAYAPHSKFKVGAALLCGDGNVVTGANVENASFGLSMCAERTAIFRAVAEGRRDFTAIAVHGPAESVPPCGACRQVLAEFATDMKVVFPWQGELHVSSVAELLPHGFQLDA